MSTTQTHILLKFPTYTLLKRTTLITKNDTSPPFSTSMALFARHRCLSSLLVLFILASTVRSQEVEDEREFKYVEGPNGPNNWGHIHEEWGACARGRIQSPIDVVRDRAVLHSSLQMLRRRYKPSNASIVNRGHDIMVKWHSGAGWIMMEGTNFTLRQMHWHSPSEHTIDGKRLDLEAHLVHTSEDEEKIAVIGILYKFGRRDTFLQELEDEVKELARREDEEANHHDEDFHHELPLGIVNPMHVKFGSRKYYRYTGSLTTPPCTEGVIWNILGKVRTVGRNQIRLLREAVHDGFDRNARPSQPANGRKIRRFRPKPRD